MKRYTKLVCFILCLNLFGQGVDAYEGRPSQWAIVEVEEAMDVHMVPEKLQSHFQTAIKRYEYVLLALELLKKNGDYIPLTEEHPFLDINDHPYEKEIIQAYNAGIIKGYGDGQFKPDMEISREEIASLMVNLTLGMDSNRNTQTKENYIYEDRETIGFWARDYIDYCYENKIIKGTGIGDSGYDIINPRGKATVEQAIIMVYRLGNTEGVFDKFQLGSIEIHQLTGTTYTLSESQIINEFAQTFGEGLGFRVKVLSNNRLQVLSMSENHAEMKLSDDSLVSMAFDYGVIKITGRVNDASNTQFFHDMGYLLSAYGHGDIIDHAIDHALAQFSHSELYKETIELDGNKGLTIYQVEDEDITGMEEVSYWLKLEYEVMEWEGE